MTQFKEGDEVLVKATFVRHDPGYGDCVRFSNRNNIHVASPDVLPASALEVNKELLEVNEKLLLAAKQAGSVLALHAGNLETSIRANLNAAIAAADQAKGGGSE